MIQFDLAQVSVRQANHFLHREQPPARASACASDAVARTAASNASAPALSRPSSTISGRASDSGRRRRSISVPVRAVLSQWMRAALAYDSALRRSSSRR